MTDRKGFHSAYTVCSFAIEGDQREIIEGELLKDFSAAFEARSGSG
jgi:hypothetical protein